jgi:hypothetical protein
MSGAPDLAFLRAVVDSAEELTGELECSACGEKFKPDQVLPSAVDSAFIEHRLRYHPLHTK